MLVIVMCVYYFYLCFLTFKLHRENANKKSGLFAGGFIILLTLISPQTLSFGKMYLDAHDSQLLSRYFPFYSQYDEASIDQLIEGAQADFKYQLGNKKNGFYLC
ncbi:hypothetical protein BMR07_02575 [Methylococcaceae bacterium CS1]|nr:hypothetical protein BMR10_09720 [Methylococcaceae bacterium CS4]TXL00670.1 hypothetical protein BMR11_02310 [Methylococcaceae bacterium CS5]TXL02590.1 hypothetical protein BMR09_16585 [Methylococcaceae bacterium CS3]TXL03645.1 hypothetical protein BMR08_17035 [Methylococcaceae bacterium CS2]TXL08225.1 hypothetical protein BMR07_02575 [Methylococcaceae bacterium CS1]